MQPLSRLLDSGFLLLLKREPLEKEPSKKERSPLRQDRFANESLCGNSVLVRVGMLGLQVVMPTEFKDRATGQPSKLPNYVALQGSL